MSDEMERIWNKRWYWKNYKNVKLFKNYIKDIVLFFFIAYEILEKDNNALKLFARKISFTYFLVWSGNKLFKTLHSNSNQYTFSHTSQVPCSFPEARHPDNLKYSSHPFHRFSKLSRFAPVTITSFAQSRYLLINLATLFQWLIVPRILITARRSGHIRPHLSRARSYVKSH